MTNTIIVDSKANKPITVVRQGHYVVQHSNGQDQVIHTTAHVTIAPATVPAVGYQQQIDVINAQLPTKDTTTIGETDLLANYLLNRGIL